MERIPQMAHGAAAVAQIIRARKTLRVGRV
jgi:hypothetical protein